MKLIAAATIGLKLKPAKIRLTAMNVNVTQKGDFIFMSTSFTGESKSLYRMLTLTERECHFLKFL